MKTVFAALAAVAVCALAGSAVAGPANLVTNGGFETTTAGPGQLGYNTDATGWTVSGGYTFLFARGTADTTGSNGQYGNLQLWGPNNDSPNNNGLPASSPDGGNFIAQDSDFQPAALTQMIGNLTAGEKYTVKFYYGFGQQYGFNNYSDGNGGYIPLKQYWTVSLGNESQSTSTFDVGNHGFTGWQLGNFTFTATGASELLSFVATGDTPVPPFALLDGVSVFADVPEPATWGLMLIGVAGLGGAARVRRRRALATA